MKTKYFNGCVAVLLAGALLAGCNGDSIEELTHRPDPSGSEPVVIDGDYTIGEVELNFDFAPIAAVTVDGSDTATRSADDGQEDFLSVDYTSSAAQVSADEDITRAGDDIWRDYASMITDVVVAQVPAGVDIGKAQFLVKPTYTTVTDGKISIPLALGVASDIYIIANTHNPDVVNQFSIFSDGRFNYSLYSLRKITSYESFYKDGILAYQILTNATVTAGQTIEANLIRKCNRMQIIISDLNNTGNFTIDALSLRNVSRGVHWVVDDPWYTIESPMPGIVYEVLIPADLSTVLDTTDNPLTYSLLDTIGATYWDIQYSLNDQFSAVHLDDPKYMLYRVSMGARLIPWSLIDGEYCLDLRPNHFVKTVVRINCSTRPGNPSSDMRLYPLSRWKISNVDGSYFQLTCSPENKVMLVYGAHNIDSMNDNIMGSLCTDGKYQDCDAFCKGLKSLWGLQFQMAWPYVPGTSAPANNNFIDYSAFYACPYAMGLNSDWSDLIGRVGVTSSRLHIWTPNCPRQDGRYYHYTYKRTVAFHGTDQLYDQDWDGYAKVVRDDVIRDAQGQEEGGSGARTVCCLDLADYYKL